MRHTLWALAIAILLVGCGDDQATNTPDDDPQTVNGTVNIGGNPNQLSPEAKAALAERLASMGASMQNRKPGMPNLDMLGGDERTSGEALRRILNAQTGKISDEEMEKFLTITREMTKNPAQAFAIYKKHSMAALRYAGIANVFARYVMNQAAPDNAKPMGDDEKAVAAKWLERWKAAIVPK